MKRLLILLLALMPIMSWAQKYKPLGPVEVPDNYATNIKIREYEHLFGSTCYEASHSLASRGMNAIMGVPFTYELFIHLGENKIQENVIAKFYVGGEEYSFKPIISSYNILYIELQGSHLKHFAVSGIQKVFIHNYGKEVLTLDYNLIEQELWRRTAEELINAIDKYKVL